MLGIVDDTELNRLEAAPAVVQVMDSLGRNRGGLTRAAFERFRLLAQGRRAILVLVAHQPNIEELFEQLMAEGELPKHTELFSFHLDLRRAHRLPFAKVEFEHLDWESNQDIQCANEPIRSGSLRRYFIQGSFLGTVSRDSQGSLKYVDHHNARNPWQRDYRDICWEHGDIVKRDFYDDNGTPRYRNYIDQTGRPYLSVWVNETGYEYRVVEYDVSGTIHHGDMRDANAAWLSRKLANIGQAIVFSDEPRTSFTFSIKSPNIIHIGSIHTTHYRNNVDDSEGLKTWMKPYLKNMANIDRLVFFTDTQRRDFIVDTGCEPNSTAVLPHAAPVSAGLKLQALREREPGLFVTVSRLGDDKRIIDAIRAFERVAAEYPIARYRIYGEGPERNSLQAEIDRLGLRDIVTLEGHTPNPLDQFVVAEASLLTTKYEGFGLVITESLACGTPVIAYDVIYGPRDIIINGVNGILVPSGDIDDLSKAILSVLQNRKFLGELQKSAAVSALQFDVHRWSGGWREQLSHADVFLNTVK